jgi:small basic protein (TIGR04137 family)
VGVIFAIFLDSRKRIELELSMSLDRSLKGKSTLERHRNVLRRSERITTLEDNEKWSEGKNSVFGLVKVAHRKQVAAKKAPKAAVAEGATAAAPAAAGAKPAAGAAAPAAGAKAAPAAKGAAKK